MKKLSLVIIIVFVLFLLSGCPRLFLKCLYFECLTVGTKYYFEDSFNESFTQVTAETFYYYGGGSTNNGYAEVQAGGMADSSRKEIWTNNVNLDFDFPSVLSSLELYYGYCGGNINVSINGVLKKNKIFIHLMAQQFQIC
ncbi:MAG: hypothetical protein U9O65_06735 [Thermotogota bacterium]|nr:hypothetical protein [Thermotogota bacterium]